MPNGSAFDNAVEIARSTPELGVGIHISLVDELCVAPKNAVSGLADTDSYLPDSYTSFVKAYGLRRFGIHQLRTEIEAQVAKVMNTGLKPTHIDSHQHLHLIPAIFDVIMEQAKVAEIPVIRVPLEPRVTDPGLFNVRGASIHVLEMLCRRAMKKARNAGFLVPDHFWGLAASGRMGEENLFRIAGNLRPGVNELMCHPGFSDPSTQDRYPWDYWWDDEGIALKSDTILDIVKTHNIQLSTFRDAWQ